MKTWTRFPFVRFLFPLLTGILLYDILSVNPSLNHWLSISFYLFFLVALIFSFRIKSYRYRWVFGALLNIFLLCTGHILSGYNNQQNRSSHFSNFIDEKKNVYVAELIDSPTERENSYKFTLEITGIYSEGGLRPVTGKILAYAQKDSLAASLGYGSEIIFTAIPQSASKPSNPEEFDYARYLAVKNVFHQLYLSGGSYKTTGNNKGNFLMKFALEARNRLLNAMNENGIHGQEFAVAAALLIGYDDLLDANLRQEYSGAGVVHVLCVSGLHVGVVFLIADSLFFFLRRRRQNIWIRSFLIISIIWLYAIITGLAPSVQRAALMFSLITIGKSINRHSHTLNTLAASAFILLIITPGIIYDLGFQLSYGAVAGIVIFQPHIRNLFITTNKPLGYFWNLINVSLAAQLLVTPLTIWYFHQFPNYFLIANLIAIPLSGILIYSGVVFVFVSFIPFLAKIAAVILVFLIKLLNNIVAYIEALPGAVSHDLFLTSFGMIVLYFLLFSCFAWYLFKNNRWIFPVLISLLLLALNYAFVAIERNNYQNLIVHNINKHTAISFTSGRNQHLLVDSMVFSNPSLLEYSLKGNRIKSGILHTSYNCTSGNSHNNGCIGQLNEFGNGFFQFSGIEGVIITPFIKIPENGKQLSLDYVILTANTKQKLENLKDCFPGAIFIADASNSMRKCRSWAIEAEKFGLKFYSTREKGAWVMKENKWF